MFADVAVTPSTLVAPYTGAWIEIVYCVHCVKTMESLPTRERGLKSVEVPAQVDDVGVAPYTGAWIEIILSCTIFSSPESLPTRERGLK